ncbi:MAG TPA: hypothetical protein VH420_07270 [Gaiellaceae bacterium]
MLPLSATGTMVRPTLKAKVTAGAVTLTRQDGTRVRTLQPNEYRIVVRDATTAQNFHLVGPGLNVRTKVAAKTTATWTVSLSPGKYSYRSDKNKRLRGSFMVAGAPPA